MKLNLTKTEWAYVIAFFLACLAFCLGNTEYDFWTPLLVSISGICLVYGIVTDKGDVK